ncbi:hypothetical protein [Brachybacterium kimchii]|uniref:Head-to-tail stopper n=1 Tax=Brachybacterium kimchii TaxID=2942909 RepID=A0ABY4N7Y7_9MICO|nr:hypothetical protein [Brachybacterium kimchii]UQN29479.1 hypothetical protein M4486_17870 [Brachybacterium kimchii]
MSELSSMFIHQVTVDTFQGAGAWGDTYAPTSDPIACFVDDTLQLVRDTEGTEVVSSTTVYAPLDAADLFTVGTVVHLRKRDAQVIGANRRDGEALGLPSHVEATLT